MSNLSSLVLLIHQTCMCKLPGVFGDGFKIALKFLCDSLHRYPLIFPYNKQNIDAAMIGNAFEMALHLLAGFGFAHGNVNFSIPF